MRVLVRNARREQALGSAPKSARELFQALKSVLPGAASPGDGERSEADRAGTGSDEAGTQE
jgi:hypothetical protein